MEPEKYRKFILNSTTHIRNAAVAAAETGEDRYWNLADDDAARFVAQTADAAEHLARAMLGRRGIDPEGSHDAELLAEQAERAGHSDLSEAVRQMDGFHPPGPFGRLRFNGLGQVLPRRPPPARCNPAAGDGACRGGQGPEIRGGGRRIGNPGGEGCGPGGDALPRGGTAACGRHRASPTLCMAGAAAREPGDTAVGTPAANHELSKYL